MRKTQLWLLTVVVSMVCATAVGQQDEYYEDEYDDPNAMPDPVFLMSPRIIDLAINRITDGMVGHYDLDEDQLYATRAVFKDYFPGWIEENRGEIVSLMNEYLEGILADEPPSPEQVADWAARVQPLFHDFTDTFRAATDELNEIYTEEQQVILGGEMAVFDVVTGHMDNRLENWKAGNFDWQSEWPRGQEFRHEQRARENALETEATQAKMVALGQGFEGGETEPVTPEAGPADQPGAQANQPRDTTQQKQAAAAGAKTPQDEWEAYIKKMIARYKFTDEQQQQAYRVLRQMQGQRDNYLRRVASKIDRLYEAYEKATPEQRKKLMAQYEELNKPLERYFDKLKEKVDRLPTRRQRADAAKADRKVNTRESLPPLGTKK